MIPVLLMAVSLQATSADQVLRRFEASQKTPPSFEAKYDFIGGPRRAVAHVLMDGNKRAILRTTADKDWYWLTFTPEQGVIEVDSYSRAYDQFPYQGQVMSRPSKISNYSRAFPGWHYLQKLEGLVPPATKFQLLGSRQINGYSADVLRADYLDMMRQEVVCTVAVDGAGVIVQLSFAAKGQEQTPHMQWTLQTFERRESFQPQEFAVKIPIGFSPYSLPYTFPVVSEGEKFPMDGWGQDKRTNLSSLADGKLLLVAMIDAEEPSTLALQSVEKIKRNLPVAILTSDEALASKGYLYSPERLDSAVAPPASPFFALVKPDGTIVRLWMGYERESAASFEEAVLAAARGD